MTRGLRNNNPLNIRRNNTKWQGLSATQTDKSFFQFKTMAPGSDRAARGVCDEPHLDAGAPVTPKHSYTL